MQVYNYLVHNAYPKMHTNEFNAHPFIRVHKNDIACVIVNVLISPMK